MRHVRPHRRGGCRLPYPSSRRRPTTLIAEVVVGARDRPVAEVVVRPRVRFVTLTGS
ncbi:hypothetical protein [Brevibacterium atlanticum]|uniref:hypothetical protein n=1 Tax=Brevibacterium atlanticum TaxID=2697563 RepID=UPI0014223365|nr:hypothetical protein [Brevibacterium atlanticum]